MPVRVERSRGSVLLLICAITAAGLLLRLPSYDDSLFGDELATYFIVHGRSLGRTIYLLQGNSVSGDLNPPLSYLGAWATQGLGGAAQSIKLTSLFAGTAAIPLTYLLGLRTVGRPAALVAAALVALSPFLIFYSTEARAYGLLVLLVLLSTLAVLRALDTGRLGWWAAYAACSCAVVYTHYTSVFLLGAQFAWAFWTRPRARRPLIAANVAAAVGYLPWLPTLLDSTHSPGAKVIALLEPFNRHAIRVDLGRWSLGHPYIPLESMPGRAAIAMLVTGLVAASLGLALRALGAGPNRLSLRRPSEGIVLVLVLALASPVGLALYSSVGDSVWFSRNLNPSWPGLALAVGALVTSARGPLRVAAVGLVVGAFAIGAAKMLDSGSQRPDYDAAAHFIRELGAPGDPVVEAPRPAPGPLSPVGDVALDQYRQATPGPHPVLRLGTAPRSTLQRARPYEPVPVPPAQAVARQAASLARGRTLFLVVPGSAPLGTLRSENGLTAEAAGLRPTFGTGPPLTLMTAALSPVPPFLNALPPRLRPVESKTFPGFMPVSVYVFRDADAP